MKNFARAEFSPKTPAEKFTFAESCAKIRLNSYREAQNDRRKSKRNRKEIQ